MDQPILGDPSKARRVNGVLQTKISKYRSSTDGQWHYVEMWDEEEDMDVEGKLRLALVSAREALVAYRRGAVGVVKYADLLDKIDEALAGEMEHAAALIRDRVKHRPGYYVEIDPATGNIIVANQHWGFCVTPTYIKHYPNETYLDVVMKNVQHLHQMTCDPDLVRLLRPSELHKQGEAPTKFDD